MALPWTINRMLLRDAVLYSLAGLAIVTPLAVLMLMMQVIYKIEGIGAGTLLAFAPVLALYYQPYMIPIIVMAATASAYGRFSGDREFIAMMTAGCPPRRILIPALAIGILAAIPAAYVSFEAAPRAYTKRLELQRKGLVDVLDNPPPGSRQLSHHTSRGKDVEGFHISYKGVENGVFERLVIMRTLNSKLQSMVSCERGELRFNETSGRMSLANADDAVFLSFDKNGNVGGEFPIMRADIKLAEQQLRGQSTTEPTSEKAKQLGEHFEFLQRDLIAMHSNERHTVWEFVRRVGMTIAPILLALLGGMAALLLQHSPRIIQVGVPLVGGVAGFFSTQAIAKAICAQDLPGMTKLILGIGVQTVPLLIVIVFVYVRLKTAREPKPLSAVIPSWLKLGKARAGGA